MRAEREDIFEKNTVLEDACGKLMKEKKLYLQQQLAGALNSWTEQRKKWVVEITKLTEQISQAKASDPTDPERH